MTRQAQRQTRGPEVTMRSEVTAFASSLALQSVTFYLFILLSFVVLHSPAQEPLEPQSTREAPALQARALPGGQAARSARRHPPPRAGDPANPQPALTGRRTPLRAGHPGAVRTRERDEWARTAPLS